MATAPDLAQRIECLDLIYRGLAALDDRRAHIIAEYYNGATDVELADELGVSISRVNVLRKSGIERMRRHLKRRL